MNTYNTIIIGGGPSGIISCIFSKQKGEKVLILEKNKTIGKKLSITGKGRCNITNNTEDLKELVSVYRKNNKFLYHAFSQFSVQDTLEFFHSIGIETKVERGNRIFPTSDDAFEVIEKLKKQISKDIIYDCHAIEFITEGNHITGVRTNKGIFTSDKYILSTGGKSYPLTGSTGDGYELAKSVGHTIVELKPALCPISTKETYVKELAGLTLKNVQMNVYKESKKMFSRFGELLFTHKGISGPIVIDSSREILDIAKEEDVQIGIDLKPALDFPTLQKRITKDLLQAGNKAIKNSLNHLLPSSLIPVVLTISKIPFDTPSSQITKEQKASLLHTLKSLPLHPIYEENWNEAIVTDGGIDVKEIDPNTMKSKIIDNLYFAGEIIDIYGPTGGYNLQMCWSTGYLAAVS